MKEIKDKRTWRWDDPIFSDLYREERTKISRLPNADDDFNALQKAIERYNDEDFVEKKR
ncbi:hypothetical protein D3C71_1332240 [compost metagenome]